MANQSSSPSISYSGVGTAALIFAQGKRTESVWFYDITADGFTLDDKRTPTPDKNDMPDLLAKWARREEGANSYRVAVAEIKANEWSLASGRYKPVISEAAEHDAPQDIVREVWALERDIASKLEALSGKI